MAFGIYIHIPHCLQRCPYCDFATYELGQILGTEAYVELLLREMRTRSNSIPIRSVDTVYFGGGTPSLVDPSLILVLMNEFGKLGFQIQTDAEVTLEINPGTLDQSRLDAYRRAGINRFSVGAQTFHDPYLKKLGRKHSALDTVETLKLLEKNNLRYNFDLIFALPGQQLQDLQQDLDQVARFSPPHLSAYVLTIPESNPLSLGRAPEGEQVEMFYLMERELAKCGLSRYEVSNYARPGFESQHNLLYWTDRPYWGIGLSAHSFLPFGDWGTRFSNPRQITAYEKQVALEEGLDLKTPFERLGSESVEPLKTHEALTDFCHTSLRMVRGLSEAALQRKFGDKVAKLALAGVKSLVNEGLLECTSASSWKLSQMGWVLADRCFEKLTFLPRDLA